MDNTVSILMYHAIHSTEDRFIWDDPGEFKYVVDENVFRSHMEFVRSAGYVSITVRDYLDWQQGKRGIPEKCLIITFDDGHVTNLTRALPILQENELVAEFFITTGWVGRPDYLSREDILKLRNAGMGIGSHCVSHPMLNDLDEPSIKQELFESKKYLEELLQEKVCALSSPGGRMTPATMDIAKNAGYATVLVSKIGLNRYGDNPYSLRRIPIKRNTIFCERILQTGSPGFIYGISQKIIDIGKVVLGNDRYNRIRMMIIR